MPNPSYLSLVIQTSPHIKSILLYKSNMKQIPQHKQPCRYGATCKFLGTNSCYYYHPAQEVAGYDRRADYNHKNTNHQRRPEGRNNHRGENNNFYHQSKAQESYQPDYGVKSQHNYRGKDAQTSRKGFCTYFHHDVQCPYGQKCTKRHDFLFETDRKLRRLLHRKDIPQDNASRLTKISNLDKEILSLRMGNQMVLFEYQFETNEVLGIGEPYAFPEMETKYEFYGQKDHYIYYSATNENQLIDIGIEDLMLQEKIWIRNSHTGKVTGIVHYDQNVFFSASITGDIKMWVRTQEGYIVDKERTEILRSAYNPNNMPLQILFLNIEEVQGVKVLIAGTNDGRILIWSGGSLEFMQISLDIARLKVFKVKLHNQGSFMGAFVLTWDKQHYFSSISLLNIQNSQVSPIFSVEAGEKPDRNLNTFDVVGELLFASSMNGEVSIVDMSNCTKIGAILHQQTVLDIICSNVQVKSTGVCLKLIYILEKKSEAKEGSFSVYLIQ